MYRNKSLSGKQLKQLTAESDLSKLQRLIEKNAYFKEIKYMIKNICKKKIGGGMKNAM